MQTEIPGRHHRDTSAAFEKYLTALRTRVGDAKYKSWFYDLDLDGVNEDCVTLSTISESKRDMLDDRFMPVLTDTWRREIGPVSRLQLIVRKKMREHAARIKAEEQSLKKSAGATAIKTSPQPATNAEPIFPDLNTPLDDRRTFDAFAVGDSNRIAWAAAQQAVAHSGHRELIYLYGSSGFGKTHLLHAIAHNWSSDPARGSHVYVTYNNLINTCVSAVWSNSTAALHKTLLSHSLLSFDDIHFLEGKNRTQEELLIVIDAALDSGKQVVIAGDLPPSELAEAGINKRLADRLAGGICAPIHAGDEGLRLEVLKKRLEQGDAKCTISEEVLHFIARTFTQSTRETIGALNQLLLMYRNQPVRVELDEAKGILKSLLQHRRKVMTIDDAIIAGAEAFGLKLEDMTGRAQPQRIVRARHAVVWCAREVLKESFPRIGKALKRDHTTVMSSYRRAEALLERDKAFQDGVARIREVIEG